MNYLGSVPLAGVASTVASSVPLLSITLMRGPTFGWLRLTDKCGHNTRNPRGVRSFVIVQLQPHPKA
jgi:hypothetical protein